MKYKYRIFTAIERSQEPYIRVFLVDDNKMDLDLSIIAFKSLGENLLLTSFLDGGELIEHLELPTNEADCCDLLILDLNMPKVNGFEVLEYLKSNPRYNFHTLLVSDREDEESRKKALDLGAKGFYQKPYGYTETINFFSFLIQSFKEQQQFKVKNL